MLLCGLFTSHTAFPSGHSFQLWLESSGRSFEGINHRAFLVLLLFSFWKDSFRLLFHPKDRAEVVFTLCHVLSRTNEKFLMCLCLDVQDISTWQDINVTILTLFSEFFFTNTFEKSNIFNLSHEWKMIFLYPLLTSCIFKDAIISLSAP